jgi:hypothetical protein
MEKREYRELIWPMHNTCMCETLQGNPFVQVIHTNKKDYISLILTCLINNI